MVYEFGAFRVDAQRFEVARGNEVIPLNRRAVQVLVTLIERAGEVVTKEDLVESVWGPRGATLNNVSQHVFMLRNALRTGDEDSGSYILTVPRVGYRFVGQVQRDRTESTGQVLAQHYCRNAVHLWKMRTEPSINSAITLFQQALREDPRCAAAYAGLALCRFLLADYMYAPQPAMLEEAEREAYRALEIDPRQAGALNVLGVCAVRLRYAWADGEQLMRAAIEERPEYLWAHIHLINMYVGQGRLPQAWQVLAQAESSAAKDDPYPRLPLLRGSLQYYAQAYAAAIAELSALVADHPEYALAHHTLARALLAAGEPEGALKHIELGLAVQYDPFRPGQPNARERLMALEVMVRRAAGDESGSGQAAKRFDKWTSGKPVSQISAGVAALGLNDPRRALAHVIDGVVQRDPLALIVVSEPLFAPLREMPAWRDVLTALGLAS